MADRKPWEEFSNTTSSDAPAEQKPWEAFGGETKPEPKGFLGHARDLGLSAVKSAIAVPETVVGLADIPTGGRVGKFLENEGGAVGFRPKQAKELVSEFHTDQYKDQQRQFQEADGILDKTAVAIQNPSLIANAVTESVAPMLAGGVAARGLMAGTRLGQMGAKGAAAAGAIGEGTMMAGSQASAIRQETDDGLLTPTQAGAAVATGLAGTLFGYLGGRVAQRFGLGDVDTMLARGANPQQVASEIAALPAKSIPRQVVEGAISEGFLEELPQSISEQIIQNLALGKPWSEGVEDAAVMGTLAGMAMGGGASLYSGMTRPEPQGSGLPPPTGAEPPAAPPQGFTPTAERPVIDEAALGRAGVFPPAPAPIINDRALEPAAPLPSQQMGLDPAAGPMSAAAALAVDTGASATMQQAAQAVDPETGEILETGARVPEQKQATDTPEQMRERLGFIEQQARVNGGWDRRTIEERDRLQAELAKAAHEVPRVQVGADAGSWVNENAQQARDQADKAGLTSKIEDLFAQGLTVKEVRARVKDQVGFVAHQELSGWIIGVRATLGIPSQMDEDGKAEFAAWQEQYRKRKGAGQPVAAVQPVAAAATVEPAPAIDVSGRTDDQLRVLEKSGRDGWREAAAAEIQRRAAQQPAETPAPAVEPAAQAAVEQQAPADVAQAPAATSPAIELPTQAPTAPEQSRPAPSQRSESAQPSEAIPPATSEGWDGMTAEQRTAILTKPGGWATAKGGLNVIGKKLAGQNWTKINPTTRATIERLMQGAPDVQSAQVDAASGQGSGAVPAGSAGVAPGRPVDLGRVDRPAGAPAPGSRARVPVGTAGAQQPAGVEGATDTAAPVAQPTASQGVQPTNVPPTEQMAPQAQEARGQEGEGAQTQGRAAVTPTAARFDSQSGTTRTQAERDLWEKGADSERTESDVGVTAGTQVRFVPLADAVATVREAEQAGVQMTPFQVHQATGIRVGDAERVIREAQAPAAAAALAQPSADVARPDEGKTGRAENPEFTTLKDRDGKTVTVRTADLSGARERMPMFTKDGKRKTTWIHRDNLDPTGEKQAEGAKEMAGNPLFNVITTKDGKAFAIKAAASRELNARGLTETHDVVPAGDVHAGMKGYLIRKKADAPAAVATHKDPGQPAEPVTQPVIAEAIQKSARNTDFNPAEAKAWILGEIDKAIAVAPTADRIFDGVKIADKPATYAGVKTWSVDGPKDTDGLTPSLNIEQAAGGGFAVVWGKNPDQAVRAPNLELAKEDAARIVKTGKFVVKGKTGSWQFDATVLDAKDFVSFDVPGDVKFKVVNTVEKLRDFRAKVEKSPGFAKNPDRPMNYGSGMAGAVNLDAEIKRIEGLSAVDRRYQGGDVLEEIGNAIEIARLKKSKDEGKLLDRFKEASKGKDYDAWRAEQEAAEETAAREASARQRAGQGDPQAFAQMMAMYDQPEDAAQQPEQPAKRYAGPSDVSSRDGQMELANRGGTIATLKAMNAQLRAIAPEEAWADANIEDAADLDALRDQISVALVRANRAGSAEQDSPLRKRLEEASGAELRAVFDALGLAGGARMIQADRVKALMSEDAQAVSDALDDVQSDGEPAAVEVPAQPPAANQPALTGPRRNPVQVSAFAPYAAGDIVALDGQDWQVQQDMGGWYLTSTGNWRGMHPTIQKIRGMNELIAEIERAATAQPDAAAEQGDAPADAEAMADDLMTPEQARALMIWEDLGQRDNVKSMRLAFFESAERMAAKRGAMNYGTIESYQGGKWNIDGTTYPTLKAAKAAAEEAALVRLANDGYVAQPFAAYEAVARTYGYEVRADGAIGSEGKFPGPTIKEKGGRLRVESSKGDLLGSYPAAPESLGRFLESFWGAEKQVAQPAAEQPASDRDQFTVERVDEDQRQTLTFKRGETVKVSGKYPMETGQIDGISNARQEFKVGGAWLPFGYAYKAEYDEFAAPRRELEEMIANAEKRIADGNGFQRDGYPIRDAREHAKRYGLEGYDDTLNDLAKRGQAVFDRGVAEDRARMAAAEQTDRERREAADAADAAKYAGPVKMTMDEWKRIHRDFKSFNGGDRTVMQDGRIRRVEIVKEKAEATAGRAMRAVDDGARQPGDSDADVAFSATPPRDRNAVRIGITEKGLVRAMRVQFDGLAEITGKLLERGRAGKRGGVIVIGTADNAEIGRIVAERTGRKLDSTMRKFSSAGRINGFYDPKSGLTFLVGPNLNPVTATAVMLHEMLHGQQRQMIDARALEMVRTRHGLKDEGLRSFLDRVMLRMIVAGEAGNAAEAAAYIVEQAVIEGRSAGYAFADNAFMQWVDAKIGKRVGDFLRSFAGMIRTWMLRNGLGAKTMTVDDFVGYAMAGLDRAAAGEVRAGAVKASASIGARAPQTEAFHRSVGDAPAQEAQRVQSAIEGKTLIEAAQFMTRSKDGAKAAVAQKVLEKLQRLEKAGVVLDLKVVHRGDMAPASMVNARGYTETGFDEKGRDIVVWLNGADVTGKVGTEEEVLLHELVHAATAGMVFYGTQTPNSMAGKHARDLMAVTDAIAEHIRKRFDAADAGKAMLTAFEQDMREGANNAFRSDDEVLAWALSSGEAQAYLETIPYRAGSMWSNFVQAVRNLLGLSARNDTALSEVLRVAERILTDDAPNAGRAAFWHKRNIRMAQQQVRGSIAQTAERGGDDLQFSRSGMQQAARNIGAGLKAITVQDVKKAGKHKLTDWLKLGLQFLGRRQLTDVYGDVLPLADYDRLAAQMEADKNDVGAAADELARRWGKLPDEGKLADLMHDATLAQIDADSAVEYVPGDDLAKSRALKAQFGQLSAEAQNVYREARDHYRKHHAAVRQAIIDRIMRSELREDRRAELLKRMDADFFKAIKGVYFPLSRFGQYVVVTKDNAGKVASVSRAETMAEAETMRAEMVKAFPARDGYHVGRVILSKEFVAGRDMVGRGFMTELYEALDEQGLDPRVQAELEDTLGQLYLSSLPDLSWAKHGIHRKGTPGFSSDARRAFAQNTFHGARYLAKLKYGDQMQSELDRMQKHVDEMAPIEGFDQPAAQRVVDEMNKRHEATMNPKGNPLSTALTSFGFVYYLGISPAAAVVNLSQTPLVAYPVMGAKWGFRKAGAALMAASAEVVEGKNDLRAVLAARLKNEQDPKALRKHQDEIAAYDEAVRTGTIDVTMAHDLAGIAQGEDAKVMWKIRPVMRLASYLFHHAERFNRQVTFIAAYRLARDAGAKHDTAYAQAVKATYDGHFDYSAGNRPRVMQGNVARVVLLFKQYAQNMIYTLARNAYQSVKGESPEVRREARKVFGALMTMHAAAAGVLGLPLVGTLLTLASALGGSDDEPWDAEVAMRNMLADAFGPKASEVIAKGFSRLTPWDISGRVGLDKLLLPDVNESLEGQRWAESFATAMLGPVIGMGVNAAKGAQKMADGDYGRGLEDMLPIFARNPIKAYRQYSDGEVDRTGVVIKDEVSLAGVLGQASGFSPSEIRLAFEGRSAVMSADRRLNERRQDLMTQFARAAMDQDQGGMAEARAAIADFNKVNPGRRITPPQMWQSVRNRERRIREADDGVYLPRTRRDVVDEGRFAEVG
jgi:hypothetical protein